MSDSGVVCKKCARKEYRNISDSTRHKLRDGWHAAAIDVNWEDSSLFCDHCGDRIESAYAEDEAQNDI
jgi:hypothetical protein